MAVTFSSILPAAWTSPNLTPEASSEKPTSFIKDCSPILQYSYDEDLQTLSLSVQSTQEKTDMIYRSLVKGFGSALGFSISQTFLGNLLSFAVKDLSGYSVPSLSLGFYLTAAAFVSGPFFSLYFLEQELQQERQKIQDKKHTDESSVSSPISFKTTLNLKPILEAKKNIETSMANSSLAQRAYVLSALATTWLFAPTTSLISKTAMSIGFSATLLQDPKACSKEALQKTVALTALAITSYLAFPKNLFSKAFLSSVLWNRALSSSEIDKESGKEIATWTLINFIGLQAYKTLFQYN
jgi:hypothetical protein